MRSKSRPTEAQIKARELNWALRSLAGARSAFNLRNMATLTLDERIYAESLAKDIGVLISRIRERRTYEKDYK